jgi:hypothetical protein
MSAGTDAGLIRLVGHLIFLIGGVICWWKAHNHEKSGALAPASSYYWYSFGFFFLEILAGDLIIAIIPAIYTGYKGYTLGKKAKNLVSGVN